MQAQEIKSFFRVQAQVTESGSAKLFVFPEGLKKVRYGMIAVNPNDEREMLIAATGTVEQLESLAGTPGVTAVSDIEAEQLQLAWRPHAQ